MATEEEALPKPAGPGVRGTNYPSISLEEAVTRARQLWNHETKNAAPLEAVASHWGYSPTSSGVRQVVAALIAFGLATDSGSRDSRQIQLSPLGLDVVLDTPERPAALLKAVKSPKIYSELLTVWDPKNLPSDQTIKTYLLRHKGFNPKTVDGFVKDFRSSIGFSGLAKSDILASVDVTDAPDTIQATMTTLQAAPATIHGVGTVSSNPTPALQAQAASEREWLRGPLSRETSYRLIVTGDLGPKEIKKLIKLLEAQQAVLEDDDDEAT